MVCVELYCTVHYKCLCDPAIQRPGFNLLHHSWSLLTTSTEVKVHAVPTCTSGVLPHQSSASLVSNRPMNHIVSECPVTKFDGRLQRLHEAEEYAVKVAKNCGDKGTHKME